MRIVKCYICKAEPIMVQDDIIDYEARCYDCYLKELRAKIKQGNK